MASPDRMTPEIFIPTKRRKLIFDATVFSSLKGCARFVDFRFNHNLVSINGKSNSLECGSMVHKYMELYYGQLIAGYSKSQAHSSGMVAAEMYARGCPHCMHVLSYEKDSEGNDIPLKCGHKPSEYPGVQNTPYEPEKDYQIGWKWVLETCEQYHEFYKNDFWVPLQVERVVGKILYQDDEIEILWKAKCDLISDTNQAILPIDHKTMKQRRDTMSLNPQFMGQCLVMDTRQAIINKIGFQKTLKPVEKFLRASMSYSAARLLEFQGEILPYYAYKYLDYLDNDYWPPNFDHCENKYGNCPFAEDVCTADPGERERELKLHFIVGPDWNPTNEGEE